MTPRLIIENIRKKADGTMPILCRINASDEVKGGRSVQDASSVACYLEEVCGVDAIHVSRAVLPSPTARKRFRPKQPAETCKSDSPPSILLPGRCLCEI